MGKKFLKYLIAFIVFVLLFVGMYFFNYYEDTISEINIAFEEKKAEITQLYIYGTHFNLNGFLKSENDISKIELILYDNGEISYNLNYEKNNENIYFNLSNFKNRGINLNKLELGKYIIYLKVTDTNNIIKYYKLTNKTNYTETEYYTIRKNDKFNYILINEYNDNLNIEIKPSKKEEVYDIVIDAGHGGIDSGACYKGLCETDFTLTLSRKLKEKLEANGLKVKLTRDGANLSGTKFETYGKDGRIDRAMSSKAKYLFSFHLNSGLYSKSGFEIYTTNNIDYTLASSIADSVVKNTNTNYSNHPIFKVSNGVYTRTFQTYEINDHIKSAKKDGYEPYPITTNTTYYYIIRETGGIMTGAYTDGREPDYNAYYNTNVGIESYILELGYISNPKDTDDITNNMDKYINSISEAILSNI